jgi:DNA polymerase
MHRIILCGHGDFAEWRDAARAFATAGIPPDDIDWNERDGEKALFPYEMPPPASGRSAMTVPAAFIPLAQAVICHADAARFGLLYGLLWRLQSERQLLEIVSDAEVSRARLMAGNVRRDAHKMTAFVRFKETAGAAESGRRRFMAWYEPDHHIVARTAPFFQRRFADMDWIIATPKGSAAWDGHRLAIGDEPCAKPALADATDELWRTYYAGIFNPARLKVKAMQREMPKKYWKNLPEAALIPGLIAGAERSVAAMVDRGASQPPPFHERLQDAARKASGAPQAGKEPFDALRREALACTRCPLYEKATQTVFGEGPCDAAVMFVGEQPGDQEDLAGRPFVGPAGRMFDEAIGEAGIDRRSVYVTNAVKHFKYEPRGKRRIHQKPNMGEVRHCRWWLGREIELLKPRLVVAMGATALFALTETRHRLGDVRGRPMPLPDGSVLFTTVHPSYLLRIPEEGKRIEEIERFKQDMQKIRELAGFLAEDESARPRGRGEESIPADHPAPAAR